MSPFYESVDLNTRERIALAPGSYGTSSAPGLKILAYLADQARPDKNGAMQHSFLVAATRPSREQLQSHNAGNGSGANPPHGSGTNPPHTPFDEPDFEGTAFMKLVIHEDWKHPAALALAWTESSRNKEGVIQKDYVASEIQAGIFTQEIADQGAQWYRAIAMRKVEESNTPKDKFDAAVEAQYRKELVQIQIKMRMLFDLEDWKGVPRNPEMDVATLVGTEFSGKVEKSNLPKKDGTVGSEITAVYSRSKAKEKAA